MELNGYPSSECKKAIFRNKRVFIGIKFKENILKDELDI